MKMIRSFNNNKDVFFAKLCRQKAKLAAQFLLDFLSINIFTVTVFLLPQYSLSRLGLVHFALLSTGCHINKMKSPKSCDKLS